MKEMSQRRKWIYMAVCSGILLLFAVFFFTFRITEVKVTGTVYYTEEEIKNHVIDGILEQNSLLLYLKYRYIGIEDIPFVEKITVTREGNNKVLIRVYEKSLIASVKYMGQYVYFDKDGIVLETLSEPVEGVPCIEGITFSGFVLQEKLQVEDEGIFKKILDLSHILERYKIQVEEIRFSKDNEVVLRSGNVRVFLGNRAFYDEQIVALSEIFPSALEQNMSGDIDMQNYAVGDRVILKQRDFK